MTALIWLGELAPGIRAGGSCLVGAADNLPCHKTNAQVLICLTLVLDGEAETLKKNEGGAIFYRDLLILVAEFVRAIRS